MMINAGAFKSHSSASASDLSEASLNRVVRDGTIDHRVVSKQPSRHPIVDVNPSSALKLIGQQQTKAVRCHRGYELTSKDPRLAPIGGWGIEELPAACRPAGP